MNFPVVVGIRLHLPAVSAVLQQRRRGLFLVLVVISGLLAAGGFRRSAEREAHDAFSRSVLSLKPAASFQRNFSEADQAFFKFLHEISYSNHVGMTDFEHVQKFVMRTPPGGVLLVEGPIGDVIAYFKGRDFEKLPFIWKTHHIYRRRMSSAA
jgi:uncharacterized membrane protein YgdD (TMEM256/DUF423 family)